MDSNNTELKKCYFFIPTINKEYFGNRLRELRKTYGMTQKNLTVITNGGITEQRVSQWENGKKMPDINTFLNICHFFKLSPDKMLRGIIHPVILELPELLKYTWCYYDETWEYLDDKHIITHGEYFYWPDNYAECHYPYLRFMERDNLTYEEAMQAHTRDLSEIAIESNFSYEGAFAWPKRGIQQYYTSINDNKTQEKINHLLIKHNLSDETLQILLGYKSIESIKRLKCGKQKWDVNNLYKLSWILDLPFEELIVQTPKIYTEAFNNFLYERPHLPPKKSQPKSQVKKKSPRQLTVSSVV